MSNLKTWEEAVLHLRNQVDQQELVKACHYDDPLYESAERYSTSIEWQEIQKILSQFPKGKVLDIGAGRGISSYAFAKDGWDTTALEPDKSNLVGSGAIKRLAEEAKLNINVVEDWGESLPFENNTFDVVYGRQVFHHANDLKKFCREIYRVLKPKGRLILSREHVISKAQDLSVFLEQHPLHRLYGGENAYTLKTYTSAICESGLCMVTILNPYESNINLYPSSLNELKKELRKAITNKIKIQVPDFVVNIVLKIRSYRNNKAGRLYSFIAKKK